MAGDQRGNTLLLFPVAVLIVFLLGAVAVDSAAVFMAQRDLVDSTQAAANDGATAGADLDVLRVGGGYHLDPARVRAAVHESFVAHHLEDAEVRVEVVGAQVVVTARRRVQKVFAPVAPGAERTATVTARAVGTPESR